MLGKADHDFLGIVLPGPCGHHYVGVLILIPGGDHHARLRRGHKGMIGAEILASGHFLKGCVAHFI